MSPGLIVLRLGVELGFGLSLGVSGFIALGKALSLIWTGLMS